MRSHKILGHTADLRLHVEGDTLQELFTAALEGMAAIINKHGCSDFKPDRKDEISVSSPTLTTLLIDFLSGVLTHSHINQTVYCGIKIHELGETSISATILGRKVKNFTEDIKAVTYHEADIIKNSTGNLETVIVFDI